MTEIGVAAPLEEILKLARHVPVFPCRLREEKITVNGKEVVLGPKSPLTANGFRSASQDPEQIKRWWGAHPDALVGVPTGSKSQLIVLDYDEYKADAAAREWIGAHSNELLSTRAHQTLQDGRHYLFRQNGCQYRGGANLVLDGVRRGGVDLRAEGGYIIWWPLHGAEGEGIATLLPAGLLDERKEDPYSPIPLPVATPEKWTKIDRPDLIESLPYVDPENYDDWVKVGQVIHLASTGAENGFELWHAWSAGDISGKCPETYTGADACRYRWDKFVHTAGSGKKIANVGTVINMAKKNGYVRKPAVKPAGIQNVIAPSLDDALQAASSASTQSVRLVDFGLECGSNGMPFPNMSNASLIIQRHADLVGKIWFDEFRSKIMHSLNGTERQWTDGDDLNMTSFMQQSMKMHKLTLGIVRDGVTHAARRNIKNSLTDWLNGLEWDGTPRLEDWLSDSLGVEKNAYSIAVSRNWPISMVARAYKPGCQVDTMPVLEGKMGRGKSSFLNILGAPWYASLPTAFGSKDFLDAIQGQWLIEVPDMTGFSKREHTHILAIITTRVDRYRASYGRHTEDHPRVTVFAATSENSNYLQDGRGHRRYWPLVCKEIDLEYLHSVRSQLFAEAVAAYRIGATWHESPADETAQEQTARREPDLWNDAVLESADRLAVQRSPITSSLLLDLAVRVPLEKQTETEKRRIHSIMRENGWEQKVTRIGSSTKRTWEK